MSFSTCEHARSKHIYDAKIYVWLYIKPVKVKLNFRGSWILGKIALALV